MAKNCGCAFVLLILATLAFWLANCENMNNSAQHAHVRSLPLAGATQCRACSEEVRLHLLFNFHYVFNVAFAHTRGFIIILYVTVGKHDIIL